MGISYAVVTKVKELTEEKRYGEAFDLLQGEDIFQSYNPQFLRCCGKVYLETDHFPESREALVKAHIMAPEAARIIYDMVHLYIKMGYYTRAGSYYELYEHYTSEQDVGRLYLQYMLKKAQRVEAKELLGILERAVEEEYSDEWGFELALLYASLGNQQKCKEECIHIMAASKKSPYCALAEALKKGDYDVTNSNFSFPLIEVEEASEADSEVIRLEDEQWKKDDLLIHPPEAVILQMEDDDEPAEETGADGSGKKEKGFHFSFRHHKSKENGGSSSDIDEHTSVQETSLSKDDSSLSANETEVSAVKEERGEDSKTEKTSDTAVSLAESMPDTKENVSSYIESVMQSVADIEASVAEELKHPIRYDTTVRRESSSGGTDTDTSTEYQSKLNEVEGDLSPKERLEKLMKLIEEDRKAEEQKTPDIYQEEELDMDEFLMNLVGASAITDAMVKNYHAEQDQDT
ncbi:MAG: hypothetical protein IJ648_01455 [Lachnospiraceae bacterium]|nr:hypothetical protein [Lachnospiraceae bacterium]